VVGRDPSKKLRIEEGTGNLPTNKTEEEEEEELFQIFI
jgi:hypothetical protein